MQIPIGCKAPIVTNARGRAVLDDRTHPCASEPSSATFWLLLARVRSGIMQVSAHPLRQAMEAEMTQDNKKALYWTVGGMTVLVAVVAALWLMGVLTPPPVQ